MAEIRQNLATKEWVIIATERARRPEEFVQRSKEHAEDGPAYASGCPFCIGNEELDLEQLRLPATADWQVRVVRNKYPALHQGGEQPPASGTSRRSVAAIGHHDVVIETPAHNLSPAFQPLHNIELTLQAFRLRAEVLRNDPRIEHIVCFKNHGPSAGTSLLHPHAQLVALPLVPTPVRKRADEARNYYDAQGVCVFCHMREDEEHDGTRVLLQTPLFTAFVPYAAYSPFHIWVLPRMHRPCFFDSSADELRDLSRVLQRLLRMIHIGLNDPDYNYVVRSAPLRDGHANHLHWYLAIVPRVSQAAGFELGTGMFINTALPEESARFLRAVDQALPEA